MDFESSGDTELGESSYLYDPRSSETGELGHEKWRRIGGESGRGV